MTRDSGDPPRTVEGTFDVPLFDFQQIMLFWNDLWPFQVIDCLHLNETVEAAALRGAAEAELNDQGIARYQLDRKQGRCRYAVGDVEIEVVVLPPSSNAARDVEKHVASELRRRFEIGVDPLARFWIVPESQGCTVGMTWQHWFADGMTAAELLRRILERVRGVRSVADDDIRGFRPPNQDPFPRYRGFLWRCEEVRQVIATMWNGIGIRRLAAPASRELYAEPRTLKLPIPALPQLRRVSRGHGVTINDLLVGVLAGTIVEADAVGPPSWSRSRVRISSIVDLRRYAEGPPLRVGGQYLGIMTSDVSASYVGDLPRLLPNIKRHTSNVKQNGLTFASRMGFAIGRWILAWTPASLRRKVCADALPMSALITNLRLSSAWTEPHWRDAASNYRRFLPPNFSSPIVLGITTRDEELTATLTVRSDDVSIERVGEAFESRLAEVLADSTTG